MEGLCEQATINLLNLCSLELGIRQVNLLNTSLTLVKQRLDCALAPASELNDKELASAQGGRVLLVDLT